MKKYICPQTEFFVNTKEIGVCVRGFLTVYITDLINLKGKRPVT